MKFYLINKNGHNIGTFKDIKEFVEMKISKTTYKQIEKLDVYEIGFDYEIGDISSEKIYISSWSMSFDETFIKKYYLKRDDGVIVNPKLIKDKLWYVENSHKYKFNNKKHFKHTHKFRIDNGGERCFGGNKSIRVRGRHFKIINEKKSNESANQLGFKTRFIPDGYDLSDHRKNSIPRTWKERKVKKQYISNRMVHYMKKRSHNVSKKYNLKYVNETTENYSDDVRNRIFKMTDTWNNDEMRKNIIDKFITYKTWRDI